MSITEFKNKLLLLTQTHENVLENKINTTAELTELIKQKDYDQEHTQVLFTNIQNYEKESQNLFFKIVSESCKFLNDNKLNLRDLENFYRFHDLNIYVIAKKHEPIQNIKCLLLNSEMRYEAFFVVSKHYGFYESELKKLDCDKESNHNKLLETGLLTMMN